MRMHECCGRETETPSGNAGNAAEKAGLEVKAEGAKGGKSGFLNAALVVVALLAVAAGLFFLFQQDAGTAGMASAVAAGNTVGSVAPNFELKDLAGNTVRLSDLKGRNVILFFNEGGMCYPSCWNQIKALATDERLNNKNTASFSIVIDDASDWKKITSQVPGFSQSGLLFDLTRRVSSEYGALDMPSSMHNGMMPGHTYYIIGKDGRIRFIFDDPQMGVRNDLLASELEKLA